MTQISTLAEAEKLLFKYMRLTNELTGKDITLERMVPLMKAVGNPEKKLRIIHVAGTSGKTSTTYYIAELLRQAGVKVGMTVSPHIDSIAERVQIDLQPISEKEFCSNLAEFIDIIESAKIEPSYFELLIAFAYWYFAKAKVDYAVIETGLGGLHDSTNIAQEPNKVCVITDIGYDHMHVLGNKLSDIAMQKAGIIHENNMVVMYNQPAEVLDVVKEHVKDKSAQLHLVSEDKPADPPTISSLPIFQRRNWHLAYATYKLLEKLPNLSQEMLQASMSIQVPARMDKVQVGDKTVIMDGAHNAQKMEAFIESLKQQYPDQKATVLLSLKTGKEYKDVLPLLASISSSLIITTFLVNNDMKFSSRDPAELAEAAKKYGFSEVSVEQDQDVAYKRLLNMPEKLLLITGSFYLIGQLRSKHKELING